MAEEVYLIGIAAGLVFCHTYPNSSRLIALFFFSGLQQPVLFRFVAIFKRMRNIEVPG
jgi:hypothetical protein